LLDASTQDLRVVRFTPNMAGASTTEGEKHAGRWMCALCSTTLRNASHPAVLPSGNVVCMSCIDKFVKTEKRDPISNMALDPLKDIISLQTGGSSFASSGGEVKDAVLYQSSIR
jgi:hypothetical protein